MQKVAIAPFRHFPWQDINTSDLLDPKFCLFLFFLHTPFLLQATNPRHSTGEPTKPTMGEHHPHQRLRRGSIVRSLRHMQTAKGVRQTHLSHQLLDVESFVKRMEQQLPPLKGHRGCVNTIAWDESGEFLLTGSGKRSTINGQCRGNKEETSSRSLQLNTTTCPMLHR